MKIIEYPSDVLTRMSPTRDERNPNVNEAIKLSESALEEEKSALAVAAPQVGINERVFVYKDESCLEKTNVVFDPIIIEFSDEVWQFNEGCLSFPGVFLPIARPRTIQVTYWDENDKFQNREITDLTSRIFQHEVDHLDGILFYERLPKGARKQFERKLKEKHGKLI